MVAKTHFGTLTQLLLCVTLGRAPCQHTCIQLYAFQWFSLFLFELQIRHTFLDYGPGMRFISFEHGGQDTKFWDGWFGVRVTGSSVTLEVWTRGKGEGNHRGRWSNRRAPDWQIGVNSRLPAFERTSIALAYSACYTQCCANIMLLWLL